MPVSLARSLSIQLDDGQLPFVCTGIMVLCIISMGYLCAKFGLMVAERFMPQVNALMLMVWYDCTDSLRFSWGAWSEEKDPCKPVITLVIPRSFPAFNLYLLGISMDLQQASAWRSLAAYIMWISIIQAGICLWVWLFGKGGLGEAALLNLIFTVGTSGPFSCGLLIMS